MEELRAQRDAVHVEGEEEVAEYLALLEQLAGLQAQLREVCVCGGRGPHSCRRCMWGAAGL